MVRNPPDRRARACTHAPAPQSRRLCSGTTLARRNADVMLKHNLPTCGAADAERPEGPFPRRAWEREHEACERSVVSSLVFCENLS